jgi:hypothetical protein
MKLQRWTLVEIDKILPISRQSFNDRFWPKADPDFIQFLPIRTAAFGKSGH